jgi:hypothetical protein
MKHMLHNGIKTLQIKVTQELYDKLMETKHGKTWIRYLEDSMKIAKWEEIAMYYKERYENLGAILRKEGKEI